MEKKNEKVKEKGKEKKSRESYLYLFASGGVKRNQQSAVGQWACLISLTTTVLLTVEEELPGGKTMLKRWKIRFTHKTQNKQLSRESPQNIPVHGSFLSALCIIFLQFVYRLYGHNWGDAANVCMKKMWRRA